MSKIDSHLAHHFDDPVQQKESATLGMWIFLATELMLFGGLFFGYTIYRRAYYEEFAIGSSHLYLTLGTLNTVVLITSSFTVAMAFWAVRKGKNRLCAVMLGITILFALTFLGVKSIEYAHKFAEGALPGKWYHFHEVTAPGANLYFTVYFLSTGLHAFHVIVGMSVLAWVLKGVIKGKYGPDYYVPVELGGLYWHLVDLVWIFLFPLLYLI